MSHSQTDWWVIVRLISHIFSASWHNWCINTLVPLSRLMLFESICRTVIHGPGYCQFVAMVQNWSTWNTGTKSVWAWHNVTFDAFLMRRGWANQGFKLWNRSSATNSYTRTGIEYPIFFFLPTLGFLRIAILKFSQFVTVAFTLIMYWQCLTIVIRWPCQQ